MGMRARSWWRYGRIGLTAAVAALAQSRDAAAEVPDAFGVGDGHAGAYAAAEGEGELRPEIDGVQLDPVAVSGPGLYELAAHAASERHRVELAGGGDLAVFSIQFAPGVPSP